MAWSHQTRSTKMPTDRDLMRGLEYWTRAEAVSVERLRAADSSRAVGHQMARRDYCRLCAMRIREDVRLGFREP